MKTNITKNKIELLAPAGNIQNFEVAINCGADAVYLGVSDFNARGNIENFSMENLYDIARKAHLFGVKVYLTLNTLVKENEIFEVLKIVKGAIEAKVDAFIIQDIGLAFLLRGMFENIELHASTQMGIENLEGARFLKSFGFKRIVLARETCLNEIKRIKDNLDIEIEYFIHGALCVGFSGNCYLCSLLTKASGNRGKCKQFCRLPYTMVDGKNHKKGYLLSTKDICMLPKLDELIECGVTSLKIEGRARRAGYVGQAVLSYRQALDNNFQYSQSDMDNLKIAYNRGDFTQGYFNNQKIIYDKTQNHIGLNIGKVVDVKNGKNFNIITIKTKHNLIKGDSLKFFINGREHASISVQDVKNVDRFLYEVTTTTLVGKNCDVNLIVSKKQDDEILLRKRKLKVDGLLSCKIGKPAKLILNYQNLTVEIDSNESLQEAKTQPITKQECILQISKLGEDFLLNKLGIEMDNVFIRKSQLNELRRQAIALLKEKIIQNYVKINNLDKVYQKEEITLDKTQVKFENKKTIYFASNIKALEEFEDKNDILVFSPHDFQFQEREILDFCDKCLDKTLYIELPVIATKEDIELYNNLLNKRKNLGVVANNYYALNLVDRHKTIVGSEMNVFNRQAIKFYKSLGFDKIILSKEIEDYSNLYEAGMEIFIPSAIKPRLIYFNHCPFKEHYGNYCSNCKFKEGIKYNLTGQGEFNLMRIKSKTCQFYLQKQTVTTKINSFLGKVIEIV